MGKRSRPRKDQEQEITNTEGRGSFQEFQKKETMAKGRVMRMKKEPTLGAGSSLQSTHLVFAPSEASPSRPQTRISLGAVLIDRCKSITVTPRSPVRHVKVSYPSSATCDFPAQTIPSFPEVVVENTTTVSKVNVVLNANATELETRCDQSGALPTKEKVVDSVNPELKHQSVPTNHGALGVENQKHRLHLHTQTAPSNANATESETRSDQSGALPTKSMSLNLTKMVALMNDYSSDADEAESRPGHLSVMVDRYKVKKEAAPILQKIFHKYGDIARNSSFTSVISSSLLEIVCDIYKKLEETDFLSITPKEIQSMLSEIRDLESVAKIDVGWLNQRLNDISQANQLVQDSCKLKEAKTRNLVVMETNKKEQEELKKELAACIATCRVLQEKLSKKKDEFGIARSENEKIMQQFEDSKAKVKGFLKKPLVHDLL